MDKWSAVRLNEAAMATQWPANTPSGYQQQAGQHTAAAIVRACLHPGPSQASWNVSYEGWNGVFPLGAQDIESLCCV